MADGSPESHSEGVATGHRSFWRRNRVGLIAGGALLIVAVLVAVLTVPGMLRASSTLPDASHGDRATAFAVCRDQMKSRLKLPEQAVFGGIDDAQFKVDGDTWIVLSEVDAADGAGGRVHSSFRCTAVHVTGTNYMVKTSLLG